MGRMIYGMMQSLDGYIEGRPGGPGLPPPGEALHRYFNDSIKRAAAFVYGRTMYGIMAAWETWEQDREAGPVEIDFAQAWRKVPKVVVSTTLTEVGPNATLVSNDVEAAMRRLKAETDGRIEVAGSRLAASLGRMGLIDEYQLFLRPHVLGGGKPFFQPGLPLKLRLIGTETLPEDTVLATYEPDAQS